MDTLAHGLYGGAAFAKKSKRSFWLAFFFGVFPDLAAFGLHFPVVFYNRFILNDPAYVRIEPPAAHMIPDYVYGIYNFSHSLVIFVLVFAIVWYIRKRPMYELSAWGLHILMDIPSHTHAFFPTPFLYPLSAFSVNGISWGTPWFFYSYWGILIGIYGYVFLSRRRKNQDL